jgi:hypothetical protein
MAGDIAGNYSTGTYHRVFIYGDAADNGGIRANGCTFTDTGWNYVPVQVADTRVQVVSECNIWADKNAFLQDNAFIY